MCVHTAILAVSCLHSDLPTCAIIYAGHTAHFCRTSFTNCRTDNYILELDELEDAVASDALPLALSIASW